MIISVFLDANVLAPVHLRNLLLNLADDGFFEPRWSAKVLEETERTLRDDLGLDPEKAAIQVRRMQEAFPHAEVIGYEGLTKAMTNNRKDRHVLAAAVRSNVSLLVTADLRGFPDKAVDPYAIEIVHPDQFLLDQLDLHPRAFMECLNRMAAGYRRPAMDALAVMKAMRRVTPNLTQLVGGSIIKGEPVSVHPALSVRVDDSEIQSPFRGDQLDLTSPVEVGVGWWSALCNLPQYQAALENLSISPKTWHGTEWLTGVSMASGVEYAIEAPDRVAYMRFVEDTGTSERIFESGTRPMKAIMVLVAVPNGEWRVHSIANSFVPAADIVG
ncbi:MAG: PIN domain-containing protein [Microlunatus sp.]|nr:PIN domain-containing protein [Microlunatus sp.]